jgi:hypothetical protein
MGFDTLAGVFLSTSPAMKALRFMDIRFAIVAASVRSTLECGVEPPHSKGLRTAYS